MRSLSETLHDNLTIPFVDTAGNCFFFESMAVVVCPKGTLSVDRVIHRRLTLRKEQYQKFDADYEEFTESVLDKIT